MSMMLTEKINGFSKHLLEIFRALTPIGLFIIAFFLNGLLYDFRSLNGKLDSVDAKIFLHMTNDGIHAPRTLFMTKAEFDTYSKMRDKQWDTFERYLCDIKTDMRALAMKEEKKR